MSGFLITLRQPGDLGVLREVFRGFSEEARTRGVPSPSLGGFGFIGCNEGLCWKGKTESIRRSRSKEFLLKVESGRIKPQAVARYNFSALQLAARPTVAQFVVIDLSVCISSSYKPVGSLVQEKAFAVGGYRRMAICLIGGIFPLDMGN